MVVPWPNHRRQRKPAIALCLHTAPMARGRHRGALSREEMNKEPQSPTLWLAIGGGLCLLALLLLSTAKGNWHLWLRPIAAAAFVPVIIAMLRGNSWQKMVAGALLFISSFGLVVSFMD